MSFPRLHIFYNKFLSQLSPKIFANNQRIIIPFLVFISYLRFFISSKNTLIIFYFRIIFLHFSKLYGRHFLIKWNKKFTNFVENVLFFCDICLVFPGIFFFNEIYFKKKTRPQHICCFYKIFNYFSSFWLVLINNW